MSNLQSWLTRPPAYTTFRINRLKKFDCEKLKEFLAIQRKELNASHIPNFFFLRPDCLVLEQWPADVILKETGNEVIVDALCAAAVMRGAHVYAPGVLGLPSNCQLGDRVDIYGDLEGHCKRGLKIRYDGKKMYVGTGYLKMLRSDLFNKGVRPCGIAVYSRLSVSRLPVVKETLYPKGQVLLQNLPSMVCGWVVDAQPNEYILDMCAAPGNKTTHLGEMSNNQAFIIAVDKTEQKVAKIKENCETYGVTCVKAFIYDSTKCCSIEGNEIKEGPPFIPNIFDKVLLDAPCSGLGQRPQLLNKMTPNILQSYKFVQRKLLNVAVDVLKVGGYLIYSTCTVTEDENENMVLWVLRNFPCLKLIPAEPLFGGPGLSNCGLTDEQRIMVQRFGPEDDPLRPVEQIYRDTIGFFIAKFQKIQ